MDLSKKMDKLSKMLECPVCLERMKNPRVLPCLHSFCEGCLKQIIDSCCLRISSSRLSFLSKKTFSCPACRSITNVPENGEAGFKRNIHQSEIGDLFAEDIDGKLCEACKRLANVDVCAASMCIECNENLCQDCADNHCYTRYTFDHSVVKLEDVKNGKHFDYIQRYQKEHCTEHNDELLKIYCEDCERPLCLLCKVLNHDQHKVIEIAEEVKKAEAEIKSLVKSRKRAIEHMDVICSKRTKVLTDIDNKHEQCKERVDRLYSEFRDEILQQLQARQDETLRDLESDVGLARERSKKELDKAKLRKAMLLSAVDYAENMLACGKSGEKLRQFPDIKTHLEGLRIRKKEAVIGEPFFDPKICSMSKVKYASVYSTMTKTQWPTPAEQAANRCGSSYRCSLRDSSFVGPKRERPLYDGNMYIDYDSPVKKPKMVY